MSWEKYSYTKAGAALLSESLSGGALTITRAVSGTGTVGTDLTEEVAVSGDAHELKILSIETVKDNGKAARKVNIWTNGAEEAYVMHQIGVYGTLNGGPDETLLFLMQDERGVQIPAAGTQLDYEFQIAVLLAVSNAADISIQLDPQMKAFAQMAREIAQAEVAQHNIDPDAHASIIEAAASAAVKRIEDSGEIMTEAQVKKLIQTHGTGGYFGKYELTLAADGWKAAPEGGEIYQYIYDAELADSNSELIPDGGAVINDFPVTTRAGVINACETYDGYVRFFSRRIPDADIHVTLTLMGKGGDSNAPGNVSIGQGLKRDESGAIAVSIGEGLEFDSADALTVRKDTVMTSDDLLNEEETKQEIAEMLK